MLTFARAAGRVPVLTVARRNVSSQIHQDAIAAIRQSPLFHEAAYVNGKFRQDLNAGGAPIPVHDPATGLQLGTIPDVGAEGTVEAILGAEKAWALWRKQTAKQRQKIMNNWKDLMLKHKETLATLTTLEMGKPLAEARGEVDYAASFIEWFGEEGKRANGDVLPTGSWDRRLITLLEPVGVVGSVCPWNFPLAMITRKAGAALAAGCPIVVKPSELSPFTALAMAHLAAEAGVPDGVLSIVTGRPDPIGKQLTTHPVVRKFTFTGSTKIGAYLSQQAAPTIKKVSLELGGNAPFIVFESADIDVAVKAALASKFRNTGQTCVCTNRIYVQSSIYDAFAAKLVAAAKGLKPGPGLEPNVTQGPLITPTAAVKVQAHVENAVKSGARLETGGSRHKELGGTFFEPTVLSHVKTDALLASEETFGPVAGIMKFEREEEAVAMANNTNMGLAAYFFSSDVKQCWRVSEQLEYGMVGVNEAVLSSEVAPFGGVKMSGLGREGSKYGLLDYMEIKYVCHGNLL